MIKIQARNSIDDRKIGLKEKRESSKYFTMLKKDSRPVIERCVICDNEGVSFCDSHSIPKFVLKQLSRTGSIFIGHNFVNNPITDKYGISNTLLFKCICRDCDSKYFKEYEDPKYFKTKLSDLAINEIAVKIYLRHYYKRLGEEKMYLNLLQEVVARKLEQTDAEKLFKNNLLTTRLDLKDAKRRIKKLIKHKEEKHFYIIDDFNLDYPTQLAYQGSIALTKGFEKIINDVYNYNSSYNIELLHLCVFPFEGGTKIVLFCADGCNRLKDFYKKYRKLDLNSKLYLLNYIILLYDEEWCVSGEFDKSKLNQATLELINQTTEILAESDSILDIQNNFEMLRRKLMDNVFELKTSGDIYNFLSKEETQ